MPLKFELKSCTVKANSKHSLTYLKFLSIVEALKDMPSFPLLEPMEERLLNAFAAAWHAGKQLTVLEAMQITPTVSSATVHRRLKSLSSKGFIEFASDAADSRIKYLVATQLAQDYFTKHGEALSKAFSGKSAKQ